MDARKSSNGQQSPEGPFDYIANFRDVGKTINRFTGKRQADPTRLPAYSALTDCDRLLAEGLLFRSARPDNASISDRRRLLSEFGIKTVMDLRTKSEHLKQAKQRQTDLQIPALLRRNAALAEPAKIPGMDYLEINVNGRGFERSLLWQLSVWSLVKLVVLMIFGFRMEAISILGREVMQPRGLVGLGKDSIDHCGHEIAEALLEFSLPTRYPILVHCTQGKDRTGLLIGLLLMLNNVPIDAVTYDYSLSQAELNSERESRLVEIREIGLTEDFADAPPDFIMDMKNYIDQNYGGMKSYCLSIGVDEKTQVRLVEVLNG